MPRRPIAAASLVLFIVVHGPDAQEIEINPGKITSLRQPRAKEHFASGIHCLVYMTNGGFITTVETCQAILDKVRQ